MKNWLRFFYFLQKTKEVGNPLSLLNHVEDYTTKKIGLRKIHGGNELMKIQKDLEKDFPMNRLNLNIGTIYLMKYF